MVGSRPLLRRRAGERAEREVFVSALFSLIEIRGHTFRNRVVMPPMVTLLAGPDGRVTDKHIEHYSARARAGTALLIIEATVVDEGGRMWDTGLGAWDDSQIPGLARLVRAIADEGAVAGIQLLHAGPQGDPELPDNERVGPSEVVPPSGGPPARALTVEEIQAIEERFAGAAFRCVEAGFGMIEVHGAHNFLLDSFLTTQTNTRTDEYGGDISGRLRMMVETCRRMKDRIGDDALLDCRISLFNKAAGEFGADDFKQLVTALEGADIDVLHISTDGAFKGCFGSDKTIGRWAKETTDLPIIVAGGLGDPHDAERAVAEGHTDLAAIGSAMMEDPDWTARARSALRA